MTVENDALATNGDVKRAMYVTMAVTYTAAWLSVMLFLWVHGLI